MMVEFASGSLKKEKEKIRNEYIELNKELSPLNKHQNFRANLIK